jgi:cellulose/xylan binding protein with CBM9 domain
MKGYSTALGLTLLLGVAGAASAATAVVDFRDPTKTVDTTVVANANGKVTEVTQKGLKGVQTGGDGTNQFLYLDVKDDLFKGAKALYMNVEYFNASTDTFAVQYGSAVDDGSGTLTDDALVGANPGVKVKSDTQTWTTQVFTLANPKLQGGMDGKADIRIDDLADGPEIIGRITISDEDPRHPNIPQVTADKPITIDGNKADGEWDNAYTFTMNAKEFDAVDGTNWTSPEDFTGTYSFKWDQNGIYILAEVIDDDPLHHDRDNLWEGDGIEVYIGLDQSNPGRTTYQTDTDFQVTTALKQPPVRTTAKGSPAWGDLVGPDPVPAADMVVKKTEKGYQFEYLLRWEYIKPGFKPTANQNIGFNMFGNDSDSDVGGQDTAMTPFKGKSMYANPSAWVTATLKG